MTEEKLQKLKKVYPEYKGKISYNTIDLANKRFGNLLVLYRTLNKSNVAKNRQATWVCECQCEKKTILLKSGFDLRQGNVTGCGCTKGHKTQEFLPGEKFNFWEIIKRVPNKNNQIYYLCRCLKCNSTEQEVSRHNLVSGQSKACQKCKMEKMRQINIKDETDKNYGFLHVERTATKEERPRQDKDGIWWVCTCTHCGRKNVIVFGDYLRNGDTKSCGCINSINESKICQMLDHLNIYYKQQITFKNLSSTGRACDLLMYDIGVYNQDKLLYLIEYDGIQHFEYGHFHNNYDITHKNDLLKNKYCFEHNIPLIRIPYNTTYDLNDLKLETTRFLLTPENEQQYYEDRN